MSRSAAFEIIRFQDHDGPLRIKDVGPWSDHLSITNDAENVVAQLRRQGLAPDNGCIEYIDSDGRCDRLLVRDGAFAGFAPSSDVRTARAQGLRDVAVEYLRDTLRNANEIADRIDPNRNRPSSLVRDLEAIAARARAALSREGVKDAE